ncbi:MAG: FtsX-like permease family protein, partial [Muribaculaceae bacterium]|nr:FtsX-like permease family protein [Muribaculaceae bacterium]
VGYVSDEVQFRAKEVAIRKVSGYTAAQIVKLFIIDILKIAIPATIVGGLIAIPVGQRWLSQFMEQTSLAPWLNIMLAALLLIIIMTVVALNTLSIARDNPVSHLHRE